MNHPVRITYVARSFLDYRIPVFESLNQKHNGRFYVIYSADYVPKRVSEKVRHVLGEHAIGMAGEKRVGPNEFADFANTAFRVVYQPGLLAEIERTKPDVIVGDGFFQWTSFALLHKMMRRTPLVVCYERTFHTERNAQWIRTAYRRFVVNFVDAMVCNGRLSLEYTKWLGMSETRITTGNMVADTENLKNEAASIPPQKRRELRSMWGNTRLIFLAVGRLIKIKGIEELLLGWSLLEKELPGRGTLVIVGDGPEGNSLRSLARELELKEVHFLGPIDYDDIAQYYASADVFVMPTLEDNWSLVVPEAMACGLPVLCSKYNGCYPELIKSDENGWVFDPLNTQDTFQVLKKCVEREEKSTLEQMGKCSREIVAQFSPESAAESILQACNIALERRR